MSFSGGRCNFIDRIYNAKLRKIYVGAILLTRSGFSGSNLPYGRAMFSSSNGYWIKHRQQRDNIGFYIAILNVMVVSGRTLFGSL